MPSSDSRTGTTLLALLRDFSDEAWRKFVDRYGPRVLDWCRRWRLQEADAKNVTQEVLLKLFQKIRTFDPSKGTFRGWLKTVALHAWQDYLDKQGPPGGTGPGGSDAAGRLATIPAPDDLARALDEEFDLEILEEAQARVRLEVSDRDWQIFQELAVKGRAGAEVARELGMTAGAAFMARSRVQQKLRDAVQALEGSIGE
jgi:RNA polymerase sigma-70 factor (ECF subfamily)